MNMKATLWLWSLVTVLVVCVSQQVSAGPYTDSRIIQPQDNSLVAPAKRTKPSLSIVNPLDVLRQRIILEMARRQMRENTRQVERNKAILREIGKRSHADFRSPLDEDAGPELQDRFYYAPLPRPVELPYLRRFGPTDYELDSRENRKSSSGGSGISSSSSTSSGSKADNNANNPSGKPINEHEQISGSSGPLTLAKEQHRLEQEEREEAQQQQQQQQELRFSDDRLMLPRGVLEDPREDDDEYLEGNDGLMKDEREQLRQQQQQQEQDKLKANGYRLRYLHNIQAKMFG